MSLVSNNRHYWLKQFSILNDAMDVYTLAEQMGTSVKMIEQHYGHLKPAQKARQIAGRRFA
jgi:hypothetical protein